MAQNMSHSARSNLDVSLAKRSYFLRRKGLYGGMLIVIGPEPQSMVLSSSTPRKELAILFPSLMQKFPYY